MAACIRIGDRSIPKVRSTMASSPLRLHQICWMHCRFRTTVVSRLTTQLHRVLYTQGRIIFRGRGTMATRSSRSMVKETPWMFLPLLRRMLMDSFLSLNLWKFRRQLQNHRNACPYRNSRLWLSSHQFNNRQVIPSWVYSGDRGGWDVLCLEMQRRGSSLFSLLWTN